MDTILVTAIGSFSADIVIKNLKKINCRVIGCDVNQKETLVDAYNVDVFYRCPYCNDEDLYIKFLEEIVKKEKINFIFPLTDFEIDVLNKYRELFEKLNCKVCMSDKKTIDICRNKFKTYEVLKQHNVENLIPTYLLNNLDANNVIKYPIVLKPFNGRSSQGLYYIESENELNTIIKNINLDAYIIQPKIDGIIITVDLIRNSKTNEFYYIPRKELIRTINGAGTSVYVYIDNRLKKIVKDIATILNVNGCVNFEFLYDDKENYYFIECNPRFSGGVEFSCIAGYDMVKNHLNIFKKEKIEKLYNYKEQYIARKYEEYVTFVNE